MHRLVVAMTVVVLFATGCVRKSVCPAEFFMEGFSPTAKAYNPMNALRLGEASVLAYSSKDEVMKCLPRWGFSSDKFSWIDDSVTGTQAFVVANDEVIVVAVRGTEPGKAKDLRTDFSFRHRHGPWNTHVHGGFLNGANQVWQQLQEPIGLFRNNDQPVWLTGHSLGGAIATLVAAKAAEENVPVQGVYTLGKPLTGDAVFAAKLNAFYLGRNFRIVNNQDVVARLPAPDLGYAEEGILVYIDENGAVKSNRTPPPPVEEWELGCIDGYNYSVEGIESDFGLYHAEKYLGNMIVDHSKYKYVSLLRKNRFNNPFQM